MLADCSHDSASLWLLWDSQSISFSVRVSLLASISTLHQRAFLLPLFLALVPSVSILLFHPEGVPFASLSRSGFEPLCNSDRPTSQSPICLFSSTSGGYRSCLRSGRGYLLCWPVRASRRSTDNPGESPLQIFLRLEKEPKFRPPLPPDICIFLRANSSLKKI